MIVFADTETYSDLPLKVGVHRYAEKGEINMSQWAIDDGDVRVEDGLHPDFLEALAEADRVVFHNAAFDRTMLRVAHGVDLPVEKTWCTMAQARSVGLPGGLGRLCEMLKIESDEAKDKAGKALMMLFCKPRPKNSAVARYTKDTHPEEWGRYRAYGGRDILAMRRVYHALPVWNYANPFERSLWELDARINERGFAVDLDLARGAIDAVAAEKKKLADRVAYLTDGEVEAATQRDALLKHLLEAYGVSLPDMTASTLERRIEDPDLPDAVRELLSIRLLASGTANAKYQRLVDAVSSDGRLRGTLEWCGAARTGRWSGRLFQPQNLPRPWLKQAEIDLGIRAISQGVADLVLDNTIDVATNAIRGVIVAAEDRKLVVSDLSNIEGRVLAWLAGEEWKLQAFRDFDAGIGHELYKITAGNVLGKPPEDITKDERQTAGKVPELACGYQGAVGAFASMAALYNMVLPEDDVLRVVKSWRKSNPQIVSFWYELGDAALRAVRSAGTTIYCRKLKLRRDGSWLRIMLPSGRALCYAMPKITPGHKCGYCNGTGKEPQIAPGTFNDVLPVEPTDPRCPDCFGKGKIPEVLSYKGIDPYTRRWSDIRTYGGKLVENVTQAVARDVMADAMLRVEEGNYPFEIMLTVHDELITEAPDDDEIDDKLLSEILSVPPNWAQDLPLAAGGFQAKRYRKDG